MSEHDTPTRSQSAVEPQMGNSQELPHHRAATHRAARAAGYGVGVVLVIALVVLGYSLNTALRGSDATAASTTESVAAKTSTLWQRPVVSDTEFADRSGVSIVYVAITGGGGLVDLRFQVVDPDRAAAIHYAASPPAIVEEETGLVVNSLLMGHSHTDPFHVGQTYYLVFENPGNLVQRGSKVSVLLGNVEVDHIVVK